ncbi:hypothetical protein [Luteolibacter sp. Populi]|uniref:hypothetical protein n=1 Tax=Luteolibacter sp. Populi TaxID=3230487 RepID=UPI003467A174
MSDAPDLFRQARETYTVHELWTMLRLPGEPRTHGSMHSPFREERHPSFSIFDSGRAWKDQGSGLGGDVVEFVKHALGADYREVREWFQERLGIDRMDPPFQRPAAPQARKEIEWPGELLTGNEATWQAFAAKRGLTPEGVAFAVQQGSLRFMKVDGAKCFVITDAKHRAAEIRRIDGGLFHGRKAYPLRGVDKSWTPGLAMAAHASPKARILLTEGATDHLTALDLYSDFRAAGFEDEWIPCTLLGASCKTLAPEAIPFFRGRSVKIIPDADDAGDAMAGHWTKLLVGLGCTVDHVKLPRGKDLTDLAPEIKSIQIYLCSSKP